MIDEKELESIRIARRCSHEKGQELIQLARLGLWAKEHGIPALLKYNPILSKYGCSPAFDHDDPSWCKESCNDYGKTLRKALSALPKEND